MTSVQSGVKEAVERVTAGLAKADDLGVERTLFGRSGPGLVMSDLRTLLAALSSQASVMEEMARGLEPFERVANAIGESWTDDTPAFSGRSLEIAIGPFRRARTALSHYRTLGDRHVD